MLLRVVLLLPAILLNQWHASQSEMVLNVALLWIYLILSWEGPQALLTVSVCGGCFYLWSTLHSLFYLGWSGWSLAVIALLCYFLLSLKRAERFEMVEETYLLTAFANLLLQLVISCAITGYWWEYGCWSIIPLLTLPSYRNLQLPPDPPSSPSLRRLVRVETFPACRPIDHPSRIQYYSDGSTEEEW